MWPSGNEFLQIRAGLSIIWVFSGCLVLSPPPHTAAADPPRQDTYLPYCNIASVKSWVQFLESAQAVSVFQQTFLIVTDLY